MSDTQSRPREYERGFMDGYDEGRRSRRGLAFAIGAIILALVIGTVIVNVFTPRMAEGARGVSEPVTLPSTTPATR